MPTTTTLSPDVYARGDDGTLHQSDGTNDNAVNGWLGGVVYRNTAVSTAHTSTTTEAILDTSYTIPANTLKAGTIIRLRYWGIATATNSTDTLTIKLYIGGLAGTALLSGTATDVANNDIFTGEAMIAIRTVGASGTCVAIGSHSKVPAASGTAVPVYQSTGSTTIDTTGTLQLGVGADWSTTNSGNSCRMEMFVVEII